MLCVRVASLLSPQSSALAPLTRSTVDSWAISYSFEHVLIVFASRLWTGSVVREQGAGRRGPRK